MTLSVTPAGRFIRCSLKAGVRSGKDAAPSSYSDRFNALKAEITPPAQEFTDQLSNMIEDFGSALNSVSVPTEAAKISLEFDTMPPWLLALVLGADVSEATQTAGAVPDEAITPILGAWVKLANAHIAPHGTGTEIVAETSGDVVIASSHYEIDHVSGMLKATSATGMTIAKISYYKAARTWEQYLAGSAKSQYIEIQGTARDQVTGKDGRLIIWCASLSPSGAVDPVAGGYFKGALEGTLVIPTGKSSAWEFHATTA